MKKIATINKKISIILATAIIMGQLPTATLALSDSNINKAKVNYNDSNKEKNLDESNAKSSTEVEKEKESEVNKDESIEIENNKDSEKSLEEEKEENINSNVNDENQILINQLYDQKYDRPEGITWSIIAGSGTAQVNEGYLNIKRDSTRENNYIFIENETPSLLDGEAEIRFQLNSEGNETPGRFGLIFRGKDSNSYGFAGYNIDSNDEGKWMIETSKAWKDNIKGPKISSGEWVTLKVRYVSNKITMSVNGEIIFDDVVNLEEMPTEEGRVGYRTWFDNKSIKVDYLKCGSVGSISGEEIPKPVIESIEKINIETFPRLKPELPDKVNVTYKDGSKGKENVQWDYFSKDKYEKPGKFVINGTVKESDIKAVANITVRDGAIKYETNFDSEDSKGDWRITKGVGEPSLVNGKMKVPMNGVSLAVDMKSPDVKDFTYETDFSTSTNDGRIGLMFRYTSQDNWAGLCYDSGSWVWKANNNGEGTYGNFPSSFKLEKDKVYKLKIKVVGNNVALWIDDNLIGKSAISNLPTNAGKIGLTGWFGNKDITLDNVKIEEISPLAPPVLPDTKELVIESEVMKIILDNNFPRVIRYEWKEESKVLIGEEEQLYIVEVNGDRYVPKVSAKIENNEIAYDINIEELKITITVKFVVDKNKLRMEVTNVEEKGDVKLQYLNFPNHSLASVTNKDNGQTASVLTTGDWNNISEEFKSVEELQIESKGKTYGFINNNDFSVTINNNVIEGGNRIVLSTENRDGYKKTAIENGTWTYREVLEMPEGYNIEEELPWSEVIISRDENNDDSIDWQDAAISYRKNMKIPKGGEDIKNNLSYIAFNIGYTQNPFLRSLDTVKKISNYTDNFGQLVLQKGYQAEGHDDSHPDYGGHIGIRQGGVKDFNTLINEGKKYNAKIGVHINATEYMKDAFEYPKDLVNENAPGWGWLDQAYYVDQRGDIISGELFRRLDMLKKDAPDLSWVYVDVYTGNGWNAHELAEKINDLDYMLATEMNGPLEQHVPWTHWGGDPAYPNKGNSSKIMRFIKNDTQDSFLADPLVKGNKHLLPGGWGTRHDIEGEFGMDVFYNQVLPTKYLQHFPIVKMSDNEVLFENGVKAAREGKNINYYRNNRLVATTPENSINNTGIGNTKLFLPWNPVEEDEKIYHWNPLGTKSQWELPEGWRDITTIQLYELTDLGKVFVREVPVKNGKVKLDVEKNKPYLVLKGKVEEKRITDWGKGSQIKDNGFDSQSWEYWTKTSSMSNTEHIVIENETTDRRKGNDILKISGNNGANATISQSIKELKPSVTYSVSAWVKNDKNREITLGVNYGDQKSTNIINDKSMIRQGQGVKFINDTFTRMEVEFTVPEKITEVEIYLKVGEGASDSEVYIDDFRIWEHPGHTNKDGYIFYENFENVDEGINPFFLAPGRGESNRTHLAEKDLYGRQKMNWVLDGRFSLKTNQTPEEESEMLVTDNSTFNLESNKTYELGFLYALVKSDPQYTFNIKSKSKGVLVNIPLEATDGQEVTHKFTTGDTNDYYISIDKKNGDSELILDNIYVKEINEKIENAELEYVNFNTIINNLEIGQKVEFSINALKNNGDNVDLSEATIEYLISDENIVSIEDTPNKNSLGNKSLNKIMVGNTKGKVDIGVKVTVNGKSVTSNMISTNVGKINEEETPPKVDKSELKNLIEDAEKLSKDNYTEESWSTFEEVFNKAKEILGSNNVTQEEINKITTDLEKTIKELKVKPNNSQEVDKSDLQKIIQLSETLFKDNYTEESWNAFEEVFNKAKKVLNSSNTTQEEVNDIRDRLEKVIEGLQEKPEVEIVNKFDLLKLINQIKDLEEEKYTKESWEALTKVLNKAEELMKSEKVTQEEVDVIKEELEKVMKELKERPIEEKVNKKDLQSIVDKALTLKKENYTASSWSKLEITLSNAKKVLLDKEATQKEVNTAKKNMEKSIDQLRKVEDLPKTGSPISAGALGSIGVLLASVGAILLKKRKNK